MGTAKLAQCLSPSPLPQASEAELGRRVREAMRKSTDNSRHVAPVATADTPLHAESPQNVFVRKLSDEEWLAQ